MVSLCKLAAVAVFISEFQNRPINERDESVSRFEESSEEKWSPAVVAPVKLR